MAASMTLAYFALSSLCILGALEKLSLAERHEAIDWIYTHQVPSGGFAGSQSLCKGRVPHIVHSYTALLCLAVLGDVFQRVDTSAMGRFLAGCQSDGGAFTASTESSEKDVRFTYAAFAVCRVLGLWQSVDTEKAVAYLWRCQRYDGAFGQAPLNESHGAYCYCVLASLALAGRLDGARTGMQSTLRWLVGRQLPLHDPDMDDGDPGGGHQGRPEKDADACYSFWVTASLKILAPDLAQPCVPAMVAYLAVCQADRSCAFGPRPDESPDLYHTYLSLAALSLADHRRFGLEALDPTLNVASFISARLGLTGGK